MGNISEMTPKDGLTSKAFVLKFLKDYGDELDGVMIMGLGKDGEIIDGWSSEVPKGNIIMWLGAFEQFKMDFWFTLFQKRLDQYSQ